MKKPLYYYNQSGVIPYRIINKNIEVLLVTSRKKKKWIIPKGIIESNMSPQESALKEAIEEAGVNGKVSGKKLGDYDMKKWGGTCNVQVYLMEVKKELQKWPEDFRERKWVSLNKAVSMVENNGIKKLLNIVEKKTFT